MRPVIGGGLLALLLSPTVTHADTLTATVIDTGAEIFRAEVPDGARWCVLWHHSVQGFEVEDCYENRAGRMVLVRSHLPDFAAGLDHIPGRGRQVSDGRGGYWIEDLDEAVPGDAYVLRPGVTFTYLGLKVDATARVSTAAGPLANVWAAGEIMAGSILGEGYLAGFGMTIGTVFGRIAGQEAGKHVA